VAGTLAYIAPELLQGNAPGPRSDIWSLGVLLYEMASGALPFQGRTSFELTTAILRESPAALPTHVTPGLRAVIMHCLAKDPANRYQHASEIRAALEALQSDTGVTPKVVAPQAEKTVAKYLFAAAAVLAIVAGVFFFYGRFSKPSGWMQAGGKLRLFLSTEGNLSGPALSPDGKMVAYVRGTKTQDLYVSRLSGGEHVRLTNDGIQKDDPQFSPDGEKIAFVRHSEKTNQPELCLIPALGGNLVPLMQWVENPTWSPDGSRLAYIIRKPGEFEVLATSAADGSDAKTLLKGDGVYPFFGRVTWSPDGKTIAASRSRGGMNREIWRLPADGGAASRLTQEAQGVVNDSPVFAPDGKGIVHRSNRGGASNIWWQPLDGRSAVQLTNGPGPDSFPSVARNGTIAFLNSRSRNLLIVYSLPSGAGTTLLTEASRLWAPAFSPDGKEIVYSRDQPDGLWHLWAISADGGQPRQLTSGKSPEIYPRFSPDGSTIFFNTFGAEPLSLWRVPWQGGPARSATAPVPAASDAYGDISPDGKWLVFTRTENKISHIYVSPVDGIAEPRRVTETPGAVPRWSPDGKWISFSPNRTFSSGVFMVHPDGSGLRQLTQTGGWGVWWPDGEQIGFQAVGQDGNEEIRVTSLTGETRTLPDIRFLGTNFPFDVSRDGKRLVTTNYEHISDEIWLLEPAEKK